MSIRMREGTVARDRLLSHEVLAPLLAAPALTYESRTLLPELVSETSETPLPLASIGLGASPLLSIVVIPGGVSYHSASVEPVLMSYNTLVAGSPANVAIDIGEALQLGRLHWASGLRQKIEDFGSLARNWDGEDALAPSRRTIEITKGVFEKLVAFAIRAGTRSSPSTVPLSDGSIRFEWAVANKEAFITLHENRIEVQRWEPRDSVDSVYYAEISPAQVDAELEWLGA